MGKHLGFHLVEQEGMQMVLKSNEGGEEVVNLLLRSKISSADKKTKEEERLAGARQQMESRRLDAADPHQGNGEEAGGDTTDAPAADDLTSDGNSTAVGCEEEEKNCARENGGSYSTGMARKERAEVSIFPREPARASPRRKIRPRERRGSQAGEERTLGAFG
jgi:hypothetical protein